MNSPYFPSDAHAARYAEIHQPLQNALKAPNGIEYARQYGTKIAQAAESCRVAAVAGIERTFRLRCLALSLIAGSATT